jgi:hypothetical protein
MATEKDRVPLSTEAQRFESEPGTGVRRPLVHFRLFEQLKQRNVFRVAALYVGMAYVLLEIFELFFHLLELPPWAGRFAVLIAVLGFLLPKWVRRALDSTVGRVA